jgi:hypothetical protein
MSEIRANSITDAAGTGAPNFPNGLSGSGASLTSLPAGQLTGALPAISGASLTNLPAPTSAQVLDATAGATAGGVGTYLFANINSSTAYNLGGTIAGSSLLPTGAQTVDAAPSTARVAGNGSAQAGTWRCMGTRTAASGSITNNATLWLRIS